MQAALNVKPAITVIYDASNSNIYQLESIEQLRLKAKEFAKTSKTSKASILLNGVYYAKCDEPYDATVCFLEWLSAEETFCKLDFKPSKENDRGFLVLALTAERGFSQSENIQFFMDVLRHPLLSIEFIMPIATSLGIRLSQDGRLDEAEAVLRDAFKTASLRMANSFLLDGALEAVGLLRLGKEVPPYLNFFIGGENVFFANKFCHRPFNDFEITPSGDVYVCCPSHLPTPIGNVKLMNYNELLNSAHARKIRKSIHDGDFKYCNPSKCQEIRKNCLPTREEVTDPRMKAVMEQQACEVDHATYVRLSFDPTCNLSCPSCRRSMIVASGGTLDFVKKVTDEVAIPILKGAQLLMLNGYGDVFASKSCRKILKTLNKKDYPDLKIFIISNAVLFTEREWGKFPNIHDMVDCIRVSIDAAREETYAILRRGGNFEKLGGNLRFISGLRQKGIINRFEISFVFQKQNMHEMAAFIEWGEELKCDCVHFEPLMDWKSYEFNEFLERAVHLHGNQLYDEFIEIIRDPIFRRDLVAFDYPLPAAVIEK